MVEMELTAVRVDLQSNTPVVLLQEMGGSRRTLPIFIGAPEATAIAYAMQNVVVQRPLTHDLLRDILLDLSVRVDAVVITELRDSTFYAEIRMTASGRTHVVSSRPSDVIALAASSTIGPGPICCDRPSPRRGGAARNGATPTATCSSSRSSNACSTPACRCSPPGGPSSACGRPATTWPAPTSSSTAPPRCWRRR